MVATDGSLEPGERYLAGGVYLVSGSFFLPMQILLAWLFVTGEKQMRVSNHILASITGTVFLQTLGHWSGGVMVVLGVSFPAILEKVVGGAMNAASICMLPLLCVLALSRFALFWRGSCLYRASAPLFDVLLVLCWLLGALFFGAYCCPWVSVMFGRDSLCWAYVETLPWSGAVALAETVVCFVFLTLTFLIYVAMFGTIVFMRTTFGASGKPQVARKDWHVLAQSLFIYVYMIVLVASWHYYPHFLPASPWSPLAVNFLWVLMTCAVSSVFLCTGRSMRRRARRALCSCELRSHSRSGSHRTTVAVRTKPFIVKP